MWGISFNRNSDLNNYNKLTKNLKKKKKKQKKYKKENLVMNNEINGTYCGRIYTLEREKSKMGTMI